MTTLPTTACPATFVELTELEFDDSRLSEGVRKEAPDGLPIPLRVNRAGVQCELDILYFSREGWSQPNKVRSRRGPRPLMRGIDNPIIQHPMIRTA
ncbi:hypothetical protein JX266_004294 [Neoarthrinium moseri]|nr:hypothetical protein JX266_004294 [Neoarthrinium moseri]